MLPERNPAGEAQALLSDLGTAQECTDQCRELGDHSGACPQLGLAKRLVLAEAALLVVAAMPHYDDDMGGCFGGCRHWWVDNWKGRDTEGCHRHRKRRKHGHDCIQIDWGDERPDGESLEWHAEGCSWLPVHEALMQIKQVRSRKL